MKTTLSILFIFLSSLAYSQRFITLSLGGNFPVGDFASTSITSEKSGFASTGGLIDLTAGTVFGKKFGIISTLRYQRNAIDQDALTKGFSSQFPSASISTVGGSYNAFTVLVGPMYDIEVNDRISFAIKAQIGYMNASFPTLDVFISQGSNNGHVNETANGAGGFAYCFGVMERSKLSEKLGITVTIDYLQATPSFDITTTSYSGSAKTGTVSSNNDVPIGTINAMVGLTYRMR